MISIEEDLLNCRLLIRQFTFNNRNNNLKIGILTIGASLVSCELDSHQIIVNQNNSSNNSNNFDATNGSQLSQNHYYSRTNWVSHVRGLDTLCLTTGITSSQSQSIIYQLTVENELIVIAKFKTQQTQQQLFNPHFFNLNSTVNKTTLEGHYLQVRSSDSNVLIVEQMNTSTENTINFASDTPRAIPVDFGDFDAVYCLSNTNNIETHLIVTLQYERRIIQVILQNIHHSQPQTQQMQTSNTPNLKMRIRITNGSVCIMPTMMNEFKCIYKFIW